MPRGGNRVGAGRPGVEDEKKYSERLSALVTPEIGAEVRALAASQDRKVGDLVRKIIVAYVKSVRAGRKQNQKPTNEP